MRYLLLSLVMLLTMSGCDDSPPQDISASQIESSVEEIEKAPVNPIRLHGELSDIFTPFSKYTDLQRENTRRKVIGSTVQWNLPVYEVSPPENGVYRVTTPSGAFAGENDKNYLMAIIFVTSRDDRDRAVMDSLKTNDVISFKGVIADIDLRIAVRVNPAVLFYGKPSSEPHK